MFEALTFAAAKQVGRGNGHGLEDKFSRIYTFVTQFFKGAADAQAGCAFFDEKDAHATVGRMDSGIGTGEDGKNTGVDAVCNP